MSWLTNLSDWIFGKRFLDEHKLQAHSYTALPSVSTLSEPAIIKITAGKDKGYYIFTPINGWQAITKLENKATIGALNQALNGFNFNGNYAYFTVPNEKKYREIHKLLTPRGPSTRLYSEFTIDQATISKTNEAVLRGNKKAETFFTDYIFAEAYHNFQALVAVARQIRNFNEIAGSDQKKLAIALLDNFIKLNKAGYTETGKQQLKMTDGSYRDTTQLLSIMTPTF